ncbi:MAG TPA: hypothetical protein EYP02_08030 [Sulfurovum sp.]|nr:hypothetical protein [Sulfurovum sp.]
MCLIITLVMLVLSIQNLMIENWLTGSVQLIIALAFLLLLVNNIQRTRCERNGTCYNGCSVTNWITNLFKRKEK